MDEIVKDFLIESNENLDRLDQELVKLESEPSSKDLLASVFRTIHTIKGSCGFLGFARLEKLAHAGESLLSRLRDGKLCLSAEITSGLLAMVDAVRRMLAAIQASGQDGEEDYAPLIELLARLQGETGELPATLICKPPVAPLVVETSPVPLDLRPVTDSESESLAPDPAKIVGVLTEPRLVEPNDPAQALEIQEKDRHKTGEILVAEGAARREEVLAAEQTVESRNPQAAMETIRVGVTLLDRLMNLVGELVLARNQLLQFSNGTQDAGFQAVSQRMNRSPPNCRKRL